MFGWTETSCIVYHSLETFPHLTTTPQEKEPYIKIGSGPKMGLKITGNSLMLWLLASSCKACFGGGVAPASPSPKSLGGEEGEKVNVTVFYEVLCPDSRAFVLRQLFPTWEKVPEIMDINYRPFGKAHFKEEGDNYVFECQHGPTECLGNIVHNCAVKYVQSPLPYIKCMMADNYEPMKIGKQCAEMLDINWPVIERCADSKEGKELLAEVGRESLGVKPHLSFIPTVALNGDFSDQPMRLKNLLSTVCNAFNGHRPENCIQVV